MKANMTPGRSVRPAATDQRRASGARTASRSSPLDALECEGMTSATKTAQRPAQKAPRGRSRLPKMGRHSSGQARVTLNGKVHYLGVFGSAEAHARYADLMRQWQDGGRRPLQQLPHAGQ